MDVVIPKFESKATDRSEPKKSMVSTRLPDGYKEKYDAIQKHSKGADQEFSDYIRELFVKAIDAAFDPAIHKIG